MKAARLLAVFVLVTLGVCAFAQMPDTTPPDQVTKLSWMLGDWTGSLHYTIPGAPEMDSEETYHAEMDGQFIKQTMASDMMGLSVTSTSFLGWDEANKQYDSWAFTNMSPQPRVEHGTLDGDKLVMTSDPWQLGGMPESTVSRTTITKKSDSEISLQIEFKQGDDFSVVATGTFKKKS